MRKTRMQKLYTLLQNSSSDESDDGEMAPRGINSKKFHRKILKELKGNFYRPTLDHTHKMIAEQKFKKNIAFG